MNQTSFHPLGAPASPAALEALQARFALRVAARLTERADELGPDLNERLRFARETALARARAARADAAMPVVGFGRGGAILGRARAGWAVRFASVLPLVALAAGLFLIQRVQDRAQITSAAEVDAALLADDLPPSAYSDAGFAEFLKTPSE
jgi:hypothetical protein